MDAVGFSGSRRPLTRAHQDRVRQAVLSLAQGTLVVTGACVGLDAFVAEVAFKAGYRVKTIVPADRKAVDPNWREHCHEFEEMPEGTDYKARNARIVALVGHLFAFPLHAEKDGRSLRSGTWQTVRMAWNAGKETDYVILSELG